MSNTREFARSLRRTQTEAEHHLWLRLRDRRLDGLKFRRQAPIAGFVADFVCMDARLIVELDGSQHCEAAGEARDAERTRSLETAGFQVIRFWNDDVTNRLEAVLTTILDNVHGATRRHRD